MDDLVKGICRLGVVPMHRKASYEEPITSELLFGEHYAVLSSFQDWLQIRLAFDGSEGWINQNQHTQISDAYYEQINGSDYKVCTDVSGTIYFQKKYVNILIGSILPISSNELFKMEEQIAFNGASKGLSQKREFEFLKEIAGKYRHAPYRRGGKTPYGIDEAGFIQQVFKIAGYRIPRTMEAQANGAKLLTDLSLLEAGDILYLGTEKARTALIYLGDNQYIGMLAGRVEKVGNLEIEGQHAFYRRILHKS